MGKKWDGGSIAFNPLTWAEALRIVQPGGYLVAFGGARTYHRMACAIEDAGWEIRDCIMWLYGTGFPKGKAQLKPAYEPIVVAKAPGPIRALQVDECRVDGKRWPANACHDGSDEVMEAFAAFGESKSPSGPVKQGKRRAGSGWNRPCDLTHEGLGVGYADSGTAARFFYCAKASPSERSGARHPTIKPLALMEWLVKLVCPPGGQVLDPFAGSGTTGLAARNTGRRAVLIEREAEYVEMIRKRLDGAALPLLDELAGERLDRTIAVATEMPESERARISEDIPETYQARKYNGEVCYLTADQVDEYRAAGWTVEPVIGHHGKAGYWAATREV